MRLKCVASSKSGKFSLGCANWSKSAVATASLRRLTTGRCLLYQPNNGKSRNLLESFQIFSRDVTVEWLKSVSKFTNHLLAIGQSYHMIVVYGNNFPSCEIVWVNQQLTAKFLAGKWRHPGRLSRRHRHREPLQSQQHSRNHQRLPRWLPRPKDLVKSPNKLSISFFLISFLF